MAQNRGRHSSTIDEHFSKYNIGKDHDSRHTEVHHEESHMRKDDAPEQHQERPRMHHSIHPKEVRVKKKARRIPYRKIIVVGLLVLIPVLVLGYLGIIPGLSWLFGTDKPRDLGVRYTEQTIASLYGKADVEFVELDSATSVQTSLVFNGTTDVQASFTQEEMTARFNTRQWKYTPVTDVQVRFNSDGTVEASGRLAKSSLDEFCTYTGISDECFIASPYIEKLPTNPAFYVKGKGGVFEGQATIQVTELIIGRVPMPVSIIVPHKLDEIAERMIASIDGLDVRSARVEGGLLVFDGTVPKTVSYQPLE